MTRRAGENAQLLALARSLEWPYEVKHLAYRKFFPYWLLGASRAGIIERKSSTMEPPWPDLIISAGDRNEPLCRWIQRQANKRVRLVHIGRPLNRFERFDLIVTTPQYRLPQHPKVLHNTTTLHSVTQERLAQAAALWAPRLAHLFVRPR